MEMSQIENNITVSRESEATASNGGLIENEESVSRVSSSTSPFPEIVPLLNHKLSRLKLESKVLRREVQHLEKTHSALVVAEDTEQRISARDPSLPVLRMPPDFIQELSVKGSQLTEAGLKHEKLFAELCALQEAGDRAALAAQEAEQEYQELIEVLGGSGETGEDPAAYAGLKALNNQAHASRCLADLCLEREGLRTVLDAQNVELTNLLEQISAMEEEKRKKKEMENELIHLLQELSGLRLESKRLRRRTHQGEWTLAKPSSSIENRIRDAIADRQVATVALEKLKIKGATDETSARSRAARILLLEKHLYLISDTVSGALDDAPPVHVDVFNAVMKEVAALRVLRLEGEAQATFLDQDIEDINYRTNSIHYVTLSTRKGKERIIKAHEKYMYQVGKDFKEQKAAHEGIIKQLQQELAALHRRAFPSAIMSYTPPPPPPAPPARIPQSSARSRTAASTNTRSTHASDAQNI